jgi:thiamine phosphate synthase YjbQ (UPF0047 family)
VRLSTGGTPRLRLTDEVRAFARDAGEGADGLVHVFAPHATAGLALMETGSGSEEDLDELLERCSLATIGTRTATGPAATAATTCSP